MATALSQVRAALDQMIDQGIVRDVRSAGFAGFAAFPPAEPIPDNILVITVEGETQTHWGEIYGLIQRAGVTGVLWGLEPASH